MRIRGAWERGLGRPNFTRTLTVSGTGKPQLAQKKRPFVRGVFPLPDASHRRVLKKSLAFARPRGKLTELKIEVFPPFWEVAL